MNTLVETLRTNAAIAAGSSVVFGSLVLQALACSPAFATDDAVFAPVRAEIAVYTKYGGVPSIAVAVARDGSIIWEEAFGFADVEQGIAATKNTLYSLASITKPITTTALMILVERGLVDLDRPINDYLGEAGLTAHRGEASDATVRAVATHTSGLPIHYQFYYADQDRGPPRMAERIRRYGHLMTAPGETVQYSNFGYGLLGQVISRVSGRPYAEFLQEEVFSPLGMHDSGIFARAEFGGKTAAERYMPAGPTPIYPILLASRTPIKNCPSSLVFRHFASVFLRHPEGDQPKQGPGT